MKKVLLLISILYLFSGCVTKHQKFDLTALEENINSLDDKPVIKKQNSYQKQTALKSSVNSTDHIKNKIEKFIFDNNLKGLKDYTEEYPNAVYFIPDTELRLLLTGPKDMKIGDIKKYIEKGGSEKIIISMIKRVQSPYKEFSFNEVDLLLKMNLSENIISTMIDVTTELLKNEKKIKEEQYFLEQHKKISNQNSKVIYKTNSSQQTTNQENPIMDKVQDKLIEKGTQMLFDKLFQ